jgi:uncharacterized iron-regulated membrane protein
MNGWRQWLQRPEKSWTRNFLFQVHFWVGTIAALYIFVMSITGSVIVYRDLLSARGWSVEWFVDLHTNLLSGSTGRRVNGFGAICLDLLCLTGAVIWWPGTAHWRRSVTVEWRASFPRIMWDLHSAIGFWCFAFVAMWGVSGLYLVFPNQFVAAFFLDPASRVTLWLADLHLGRFGWLSEAAWAALGLMPAVLAFTGIFICCRRVMFGKSSSPRH